MGKISIKKFVEGYSKCATKQLKDQYIKDNLEITTYVPFLTKDALINNLLKISMFDKNTGNVQVNSAVEYLLMTRIFVEQYTNLTVETEGFYEEYDELKKSGLFNILLIGDEDAAPLIPYEEIAEFKHLLSIKRNDVLQNKYEIHSFITEKIDRIKDLGEAAINPLINVLDKKFDELSDEDKIKIIEFAKKGEFK